MPRTLHSSQFGDKALTTAEAYSACGPAAAQAFARLHGRNPTLREAVDLAKQVGWSEAGGMNGFQNQKRLLDKMGIPATVGGTDPASVRKEVEAGGAVAISTPKHYYVVSDVDAQGRFYVGSSGTDRKGGSQWMTLDQISRMDGGINGALYTRAGAGGGLAEAAGGPKVLHKPAEQGAGMDAMETWSYLEKKRGKPASVTVINPEITEETEEQVLDEYDDPTGRTKTVKTKKPNPTPTYKILWSTGEEIHVKTGHNGVRELVLVNTEAKAAMKEAAAAEEPDDPTKAEKDKVALDKAKIDRDKAQLELDNARSKASTAPTETDKRLAELEIKKAELAVQKATIEIERAQKPAEADLVTIGRSVYRKTPEGNLIKVHEEPRDVPLPTPRQERYPEEIEASRAQIEASRAGTKRTEALLPYEIQKAQQGLAPPTLLAVQNHLATVDQIEKMIQSKQLDPAQATAYIDASQKNLEAAFRGTTVFDEQKERRADERARQNLGKDLLNQRLTTGASLASALTSSAFGSDVMMPAGQSSLGYAPAALAMQLTDELQGGPRVNEFARSLLMGSGVTDPMGGTLGGMMGSDFILPPRPSMPR